MKITPIELNKNLREFYNSLIVNIFTYFTAFFVVQISMVMSSQILIFLSIFLIMFFVFDVFYTFYKFVCVEDYVGNEKMNFFLAQWIKTTIDDAKKIKNFILVK